jgi:hypothetical protein
MSKRQGIALKDAMDWCKREFSSLDLGDPRRKMRLIQTAEKLASQPQAPINKACENWKDTKAAYRLFSNDHISGAQILKSHQEKTRERVKAFDRVLVIQDTTFLNYHGHVRTVGLGRIGNFKSDKEPVTGLIMHSALAVTPKGVPLGILSQKIWSRDQKKLVIRQKRQIEERESHKWIQGLEETKQWLPSGTRSITLCDREADIYEFFSKADELGLDVLVRARNDRLIHNGVEFEGLWKQLKNQPVSGQVEVKVTKIKNKQEITRIAKFAVRFCKSITLHPPAKDNPYIKEKKLSPVPNISAVFASEMNPPEGEEALEWMLLTSVPVTSHSDALERIEWYKMRWHIENFHKVLKSGCQVEECRLQTADKLKRYLTLFSIIAWRLYWMTHIQRHDPESSCENLLAEHEWKSLHRKHHPSEALPRNPPTARQAIRWIAQLGGFLARKSDGEPGITTIWRGWERLMDLSEGWALARRPAPTCG